MEHTYVRYFVTGTDTGVGKTFTTAALARLATARGERVLAFKPVETGVSGPEGEDQTTLCAAAGDWQRGPERGLYQFRLPAAPAVAAEAAHATIDLSRIAALVSSSSASSILVEGAGGWRVPFTPTADTSTLARLLALPVIVVAHAGLGTINHSLLTLEAITRDSCPIAALVLSRRPTDDLAFALENASQIARRWPGRVIVFSSPSDLSPLLSL